jgi:MFS family permease
MKPSKDDRNALMREPNFRWMLGGGAISMLGDQFSMMALPWLVLKMTNDPLAMGLVVAMMGVPRAIFILIGGALVDRYSPKNVLMLTKFINAALLALLAVLVWTSQASMPVIYVLAMALGLAQAFSIPSGSSLMPQVVDPVHLQTANGMLMGIRQVSLLAGPLMAGLVIAAGGDGSGAGLQGAAAHGIALAFAFDCFTFLLSAWTLSKVQVRHAPPAEAPQAILKSVGAGLSMVWKDTVLRACFLYWAGVSFFIGGTLQVALPVLASDRLHGASALGLLLAANGIGSFIGMALTSVLGKLRIGTLGTTLLAVDGAVGLLMLPMGLVNSTWQGAALLLLVGVLAGFMQIAVFSWIQQRVPRAMLGRAMSICMFIFMGVAPLSAAFAGGLMQSVSLAQLFAGSGLLLILLAVLAFVFTPMRDMTDFTPPAAEPCPDSQPT